MACTKSARYVHARLVLMQACTFLATRMLPDSRSTWLHTTGDSSRSQTPSVSRISAAHSSKGKVSCCACFSALPYLMFRSASSLQHHSARYTCMVLPVPDAATFS